ncbi:3-isopropylmalate dehydratase small subunit [Polymorphobacter megasporae]|nr:3-isopropylmalate dehydratase small subunit [Polymorphobacter megasporae]
MTAAALVMPEDRIDTDILFPARFLLLMERDGLGRYLCYDRRHDGDVLVANPFDDTPGSIGVLIAGAEFGCGSSREQAVWALADFGIRCIFAESFGEIFAANCVRNGVLAVTLPRSQLALLADMAAAGPLDVDLPAQRVGGGNGIAFDVQPATKKRLLNGWDEIDTILGDATASIAGFETLQRSLQPWLY